MLRLAPALPPVPATAAAAEAALRAHEAASPIPIRPDNEARVLWSGSPGQATGLCFVYLHGYSASWREGGPVHQATARRYGANLLLSRLSGHGLQVAEPMLDFDPAQCWQDAKQALAWGLALGLRVILMATSSGAPLALRLAALHPGKVEALVLYSPNVRIRTPLAPLMAWPGGLHLARAVKGSRYNEWQASPAEAKYWYQRQRLEGAVQLQHLLNAAYAGGALEKVRCPVFGGVYYKDESAQDSTISVPAARAAFARLGSLPHLKRWREYPGAGRHVIACDLSSGAWQQVQADTWEFLEGVVGLRPR